MFRHVVKGNNDEIVKSIGKIIVEENLRRKGRPKKKWI